MFFKPITGILPKLLLAASVLASVSFATACKPRQAESETKQIFNTDLPGSPNSQRVWDLDAFKYPYIIYTMGCTGFILDKDANIAMSAHHCSIVVGQHICHGAPGQFSTNKMKLVNNKVTCPTEMVITSIIEESRYGDMDYVIFKYDILDSEGKVTTVGREKMENVRVLGSLKHLGDLYANKTTINLTGYPADEYAKGTLTHSWGVVRSEVRQSKYYRLNKANWEKLQAGWDANPRRYKADPVRYREMLECLPWRTRFTVTDPWVFYFDASVYGGNSGGPVYYLDEVTKEPIVLGFPSTYLRKPPAPSNGKAAAAAPDCYDEFTPEFITPILGANYTTIFGGEGQPDWNNIDRQKTPVEHLPAAIPMPMIVQKSKFFANRPDLVFVSKEADLDSAIDKAADSDKVDALDSTIDDALK